MTENTQIGGGKALAPNSPLGSAGTAGGHQGMSTLGANDNASVQITGAGLSGVAGAAIAAVQFVLANNQLQLAQDYFNTNKVDFDFYQNNYAEFQTDGNGNITGGSRGTGPLSIHKNQAFATPFYTADYLPMTGASLGRTKVYDEKWFQTRRRMHRYAVGAGQQVDYNFYMMRRKAAMSMLVAGRRIEDARKDWKDEQIQTHKVQALNFGITAGNIAKQGLASATATLEHAYDEMGSRIGGLSSGLGRYSGYESGQQNTQSLLSSSSQSGRNMAPHTIGTGGE